MIRRWVGLLACVSMLVGVVGCSSDETEEWNPTGGGGTGGTAGTGGTGGIGGSGGTGGDPGLPVGELASRTSGVAPLAVFFDAVGTPDVVQPPEVDGHREYADWHYQWDFGDPGAGTWVTSSRSKNEATGYVAAHVYETPGTYTAQLTVTDSDGANEHYQVEITVDDPEVVYASTATICVSTSADFTGCPDGATEVTTTTFTDIEAHLTTGQRVLLRRGDSWATSETVTVGGEGPTTLGAFGDCQSPDARGHCANAPTIDGETNAESSVFRLHNVSDTRLMDLAMVSTSQRWAAIGGATGIEQVLALRLHSRGFMTPLGDSHWETDGHDHTFFVDNDAGESETNVIYVGSERLALLGNRFFDPQTSHVARVWQAHKGVISHNDLSGSSVNSDTGRHALKFHGPDEDSIAGTDEASLAHRTRFVVVSNNVFGGSGPWPVAIGPQNSTSDERLADIVVEQNRFYPGYGTQSCCSSGVQVALSIWARHVTVRNNLFSGQGSSQYYTAIALAQRGGEPEPLGHRIFHNTIYKSDPPSEYCSATAFSVDATVTDSVIQNNFIHFAAGFDAVAMLEGDSTGVTEDHNMMTDDPGLVDPDNADFLAKDFSLTASSPAIDAGTTVPVFDDFLGANRPSGAGYDLGAIER